MIFPITKPTLPKFEEVERDFAESLNSGMITNYQFVRKLEKRLEEYMGVKHVVAVNSCTAGMMLCLKSLGLKGEVILPSFTFSATGHVLLWNGLKPRFVEVDEKTYNLDPRKVLELVNENTCAILGVHLYGCPADVEELERISKEKGIKLFFDAAHAMGSKVGNRHVASFGDASIFSCSPTKLLVTAEGGFVATNNDKIAENVRVGRVYGNLKDYSCAFPGLNARMSEFHAILGLKTLDMLEENIEVRNNLVSLYKKELSGIAGLIFQVIPENFRSTYKDFAIFIDPILAGFDREQLHDALKLRGIQTKKYFFPPVHELEAFKDHINFQRDLVFTEKVSRQTLSLPLFSHMKKDEVMNICSVLRDVIRGFNVFSSNKSDLKINSSLKSETVNKEVITIERVAE